MMPALHEDREKFVINSPMITIRDIEWDFRKDSFKLPIVFKQLNRIM